MYYILKIKETNVLLNSKNKKPMRTPFEIKIPESDKSFWDIQIRSKGIIDYQFIEMETIQVKKEEPPRMKITDQPLRPSNSIRGK
jgi:hypothetical protein